MRALALAAAAISVLAASATVSASTPSSAAGGLDFRVVSTTETGESDGNAFYEQLNSGTLTGTFAGTFETIAAIVVHQDGSYDLSGTRTCDCTVDGRSGTVVFRVIGSGVFGASFHGRLVVVSADGDVRGLHSVQTFEGTFVALGHGVGSYSGTYHLDP